MFKPLFALVVVFAGIVPSFVGAQVRESKPEPVRPAANGRPAGQLDSAAKRNENIVVVQIDTEAIKEANIRLGSTITAVSEAAVETTWFAAENGRPAGELFYLRPAAKTDGWHAELFHLHQNSVFNARAFFQVGGVMPSRRNNYGGRFSGNLGKLGYVSGNASQNKIRGMVNGNVLVPLADERRPLTTDPARRAIIERYLAAFPTALPNRPDFDPRALNTNSPQRIDDTTASLRLEPAIAALGGRGRVSLMHTLSRQRTSAFQLVAGQNPNTEIHNHRSRATLQHSLSPVTDLVLGASFNRTTSVLVPEPNAVGMRVRFGFQIQELGPDSQYPIDRALNTYRIGGMLTRSVSGGRHTVMAGGDVTRLQLNGIETNNQRGFMNFTNNFGRTAIENLLLGTPSLYETTIGELNRGFRNWSASGFAADRWRVNSRLQIYFGLRYSLLSAPVEVNGLDTIPYGCDCNNFSPRFSIAYRPGGNWVMRTSYHVSFGEIMPVTYQQIRNNPPLVRYVQVQTPDLVDPLKNVSLEGSGRYSPTALSPELVSPYAHQYNFSLEHSVANRYNLRLSYIGSRSVKLLNTFISNRAEPVPGIPLTPTTVDQRRPDPRYYEVYGIVNAGLAYLDAAQAAFEMPSRRGFNWGASYTFGKALDEGVDYASTGANGDLSKARSQWQYESLLDRKGLSLFDSTHAALIHYAWELPRAVNPQHWLSPIVNGWQVSGATLLKSGTPLTLYVGSDAPGFGNVDGGPSDRPNILDPTILGRTIDHPDTAPLILTRDRFAYIRPGEHRGSVARNAFRKDGIANFNAAVTKQWRINARREWTALLRAEAYNLTNHPQFDEPQRNLSSPAFGRITNTLNDGRILQIGLRLIL